MSYGAPWKRSIVTSTAKENAIRRRICVVSRIRDAEYGLVAHGSLAAAAATLQATRPPLQSWALMHRSLLRRANVGYGGPRAAYDAPNRNRVASNSELRKRILNQEGRKAGNKRHHSLTNHKSFRLFQAGKFGELASFTRKSSLKISLHLASNRRSCRNCMPHRCSSGNFCRSSCKQVDLPQIQSRKSSPRKSKTEF